MLSRRTLITASGTAAAGALLPHGWYVALAATEVIDVRMRSDEQGGMVHFDPIGVLLQPGQRVRWTCEANVHTTTAYHPQNANHSLRIPADARPWDSRYLLPGKIFEIELIVGGVYDYFCTPHEAAGMVGRLIVGKPAGPGALPFDYFIADPQQRGWRRVPKLAQAAFPKIDEILAAGAVHPP